MSATNHAWEHALDQPGSAGPATIRHSIYFAAIIVILTVAVVTFGDIALVPYPQFVTFHAGFVFLVDAITAFLLFGQFAYRRQPSYLVLACAFSFSALVMIPFLLSFPGALRPGEIVLGGEQSAIWVWHFWHTLFPAVIALALAVHTRAAGRLVPARWVARGIFAAAIIAVLLVAAVATAVTVFHDLLPPLIQGARHPLKPNFYWAGGVAAAVTLIAFALAVRLARQRASLYIWLSMLLFALLADEAASLGAYPRFSVGWYFSRVDSMLAVSTLLVVFLHDINRIYYQLARATRELFDANRQLSATVEEKDQLLAELRQSEAQIRRMAYHDAVTGLPNRRLLMEALAHTLAQGARHGHVTGLLFLDLDRFKQVNDTLGHDVGDALLKEAADRLTQCVRAGDTVARLGGDEFVIVLPEIDGARDATAAADKILALMTGPMVILGHRIDITVSIGIVTAAGPDLEAEALVRRADEAMYAAKKAGGNQKAFSALAVIDASTLARG